MLTLKYLDSPKEYEVNFCKISAHVVQLLGDFPFSDAGFILSRKGKGDNWDYKSYTTLYRSIEGGMQFSDDGSVYVAPPDPEPAPDPEPYVPTLQEVQEAKVAEMNAMQQAAIRSGITVTLTDGTAEHFTLTDHDQTSLMGLQSQVLAGEQNIPWHTSNEEEHCKFYSNADMALITDAAMKCVTWHVTYFRDLRIYIRSLAEKVEVEAVTYGMDVPEEYQSEPLRAMIAAQNV